MPAGIADEQVLQVSGQGDAGYNGGPAGDLHVFVNVRPTPSLNAGGRRLVRAAADLLPGGARRGGGCAHARRQGQLPGA